MRSPTETLVIGWREYVALPGLGIERLAAKIDTGARTSALHAEDYSIVLRDGVEWVAFHVPHAGLEASARCEARLIGRRHIRNTSGIAEERLIVETTLRIAGRRWRIELSLADRMAMAHPLILGRTAIRGHRVLVNPGRSHLIASRDPK